MLEGITVVDLSQFLPGPVMTMMMADQGARVIKVEPPSGDPARQMEPFEAGHSVWFANCNRGKESVALDLKSDAGKAALRALCAEADVFVEGFRPGAIARLGFDYDAVRAIRPDVIYCSISAFGQDGPLADHPAHDMAVQAMTGHLAMNDGADGKPVVPGVPAADMAASLTALSGVLMALIGRARTGEGAYLDCAMFDALLPWTSHIAGPAIAGGESPVSASQRSTGGAALYQVYATADGGHIALAGREPKFAKALLEGLGREDLLDLALRPAGEQSELIAVLRETFASRTRAEWEDWFHGRDVAFAPVLDFREAFDAPQVRERGLMVTAPDGSHHIAPAIRFAGQDKWSPGAVPGLGDAADAG
ncbi:CaiB/BaiF CoA transferase family protein [Paraurantiacibacter namhicola]|nr:CoA transferase [Paraurantiacibacter namhicola]